MAHIESGWTLREARPTGKLPARFVGNPDGGRRYVESQTSAYLFATAEDAEAARRPGEIVQPMKRLKDAPR